MSEEQGQWNPQETLDNIIEMKRVLEESSEMDLTVSFDPSPFVYEEDKPKRIEVAPGVCIEPDRPTYIYGLMNFPNRKTEGVIRCPDGEHYDPDNTGVCAKCQTTDMSY